MGMIVVSGKVTVLSGNIGEALKVSQEHVVRSRSEAGCTSHGVSVNVSVNAEAANQLIFFEQWENLASLKSHFVVPKSPTFATAISKLASTPQRFQFFYPRKSSLTPREQEMSQHAE
jgi:quinol monooxygenase YgiN